MSSVATPLTLSEERRFEPAGLSLRPTDGQQLEARTAFDGTRALVTWFDSRQDPENFRHSMFGAQFPLGGAPTTARLLASSLELGFAEGVDLVRAPGSWQVSLTSGDVAVMEDSGSLRLLTPGAGRNPRLAAGSTGTLIVGQAVVGNTRQLRSTLLDLDGGLAATALLVPDLRLTADGDFAVAATRSGFLVVWQDGRLDGGVDLFAQRLDGAGSPAGVVFAVDTSAGPQSVPQLGANGDSCAVAFLTAGGRAALRAISSADAVSVQTPLGAAHPNPLSNAAVQFNGATWLAVFLETVGTSRARVVAQRFDVSLAPVGTESVLIDDFVLQPTLAVAGDGRALISWSQWNGSGSAAVRFVVLAPSGYSWGPGSSRSSRAWGASHSR